MNYEGDNWEIGNWICKGETIKICNMTFNHLNNTFNKLSEILEEGISEASLEGNEIIILENKIDELLYEMEKREKTDKNDLVNMWSKEERIKRKKNEVERI